MATRMTRTSKAVHNPTLPLCLPDLSAAMQRLPLAAVLPEQFHGRPGRASVIRDEVALMHAVLFDAVECFRKQAGAPLPEARRLAREAERWLFTDDDRWPFSFVNVCAVLGLNPAYVRRGLRGWQRAPLARSPGNRLRRMLAPRFSSIVA